MHMSMGCVLRCTQQIQTEDSVSVTVFPLSERWLNESSDHEMAAKYVRSDYRKSFYRSLMDFLFASVFPGTDLLVRRYYKDLEPPLRDILTKSQCHEIDRFLLAALEIAYEAHCEKRRQSWSQVCEQIDELRLYAA